MSASDDMEDHAYETDKWLEDESEEDYIPFPYSDYWTYYDEAVAFAAHKRNQEARIAFAFIMEDE